MTLTSILPTLRHSIASPFTRDLWPARTSPTLDDVVIGGVSILRYVALCATPCVTSGPAVLPLSGGVPSSVDTTTILTVSVVAVDESGPNPVVLVDGALSALAPAWSEIRLLGRVSSRHDRRFGIRDAARTDLPGVAVILPGDITAGDLLAMPCAGAHTVGELR